MKKFGYENMTKSALIASNRVKDELLKGKDQRNEQFFNDGFKEGHDQAVVESAEVIRHLNSQITGLKGVITIKNKELDNSAIVVAQKDEIIARKDDTISIYEERLERFEYLLHRSDKALNAMKERLDIAIEIAEKERNKRLEAEDLFYNEYEKNEAKDKKIEEQDKKIKDLEKRLHLVNVLTDTEKDLPKGLK